MNNVDSLLAEERMNKGLQTKIVNGKEVIYVGEGENQIGIGVVDKNIHTFGKGHVISYVLTEVGMNFVCVNEESILFGHGLVDVDYEERIKDIKEIIKILETISIQMAKLNNDYILTVGTQSRFEGIFGKNDIILRIKQYINNLLNGKKLRESIEYFQNKKYILTVIIEVIDNEINYYKEKLIQKENIGLNEYIKTLEKLKYRFQIMENNQENYIRIKKEYNEKILGIK